MKVFLTGGTGSIGKAVLTTLLAHHHQVTCTVKDATSHASLQSAFPSVPNLTIVDHSLSSTTGAVLTALSTGFDSIIHTAQNFSDTSHEMELVSIDAFIAAGKATSTAGRPCHLIITTDVGVLGTNGDEEVDEDASTEHPNPFSAYRVPLEKHVLTSAEGGFTTAVVRPAWVYGCSAVDKYILLAKERRYTVAPAVTGSHGFIHKDDLAELYRLVMETRASGAFNGAEPRAVSAEDVIGKLRDVLGVEVARILEPRQLVREVGFYIIALAMNKRVKPKRSLELGWRPQYSFLDDFTRLYSS